MSSIQLQESQHFLQLWKLTTGPAINAMQHVFEVKILNSSTFESFLNNENNKHILFHQCFPTTSCCKCITVSLASATKIGCLDSRQFKALYDNSGLPQPGHEPLTGNKVIQYCLCKYSAKCSIKVNDLDFFTFYHIIEHCCPYKMNFLWRKSIKDVRNYLAHASSRQVTKAKFQDHWKTLETATLGFACEIGDVCGQIFKDEISRIQYSSIDLQEMLKKKHKDFIALRIDLNAHEMTQTIAEKLEELEKTTKLITNRQLQQEPQNYKFNERGSDSLDTEDPKSKRKVLKLEFGKGIQARSRSASLSQLHLSILEDNDIEKDWFYKLNITCDNYSLHLINDFNIPRKFKALSKTVQFKGQTKLTPEYSTNEESPTAFERIYQHIICSNILTMSDCIKQNLDLAVRFLLARHIAPTELIEFLHESLKENKNAISKAIGWTIIKQFCKDILLTKVENSFIDIWPGFRCLCKKHSRKGHSRICSTEPVIIVEVNLFSNTIPDAFYGIPIQQSYPGVKREHTKVQCHEEKIQTPVSISGEVAEMWFKQHSKMTMIHVHPLRSKSIQLWAQIKGVVPMGEKHFPKLINGLYTYIAEGHVRFTANIKIGDTIGVFGSAGTLGGFVQMHGYNAFLTCAHVVHSMHRLIAGNKRELHKSKTKVFCLDKYNPNLNVESGYVFNEAFDFNNSGETSIDAAVVILDEEKVKFDEKDILNNGSSGPISVDFLGMKGPYLNDNYITPKAVSGTVTARYVGMISRYVESNVTFEDYDKDEDKFKKGPQGLCVYFKDLQTHLEDIKSQSPTTAEALIQVHFQQLVVPKLEEVIKSGRHYFRCYNQLLLTDFSFEQGDSGTCIYVVEDKTIIRPDNQPNPTGCLAMAIASFMTAMKKETNALRHQCKQF